MKVTVSTEQALTLKITDPDTDEVITEMDTRKNLRDTGRQAQAKGEADVPPKG